MIKAVIIEDEIRNAMMLQKMIVTHCPNVDVVGSAEDVAEAYTLIKDKKPALIFLDIELPSGSAFDLLAKFNELPFYIVFTTAYKQYALRALKNGALDYLLKPIDSEELCAAVKKATGKINEGDTPNFFNELLSEIKRLQHGEKISLPTEYGKLYVREDDVLYCSADGSYTHFYLNDGKEYLVSKNIKEFEEQLSHEIFFRIHNLYIVNVNYVSEYRWGRGGTVILKNGKELSVSLKKRDDFLNLQKRTTQKTI